MSLKSDTRRPSVGKVDARLSSAGPVQGRRFPPKRGLPSRRPLWGITMKTTVSLQPTHAPSTILPRARGSRSLLSSTLALRAPLICVGLLAVLAGSGRAAPLLSSAFLAFDIGPSAIDVEMGDVDGDGRVDLLVLDGGEQADASNISLLLGNGDRTFQPRTKLAIGESTRQVKLADLNGDLLLDLVLLQSDAGR